MDKPQAFIFDLDGVITDTARYHFVAWQRLAQTLGIVFNEEDNEALKGLGRRESLLQLLNKSTLSYSEKDIAAWMAQKNADYLSLITDMTPADILPNADTLLHQLRAQGYKIGLASASRNAPAILNRLGITQAFDFIADAGAVTHSKPAPDIFIAAAKGLNVPPLACIGVEDAAAGVAAIKSAHMYAVGIGDPAILEQADIIFPDMTAVDVSQILKSFAAHR